MFVETSVSLKAFEQHFETRQQWYMTAQGVCADITKQDLLRLYCAMLKLVAVLCLAGSSCLRRTWVSGQHQSTCCTSVLLIEFACEYLPAMTHNVQAHGTALDMLTLVLF